MRLIREGGALANEVFFHSRPLQFLLWPSQSGSSPDGWWDSAETVTTRKVGGCRWLSSPPLLRRYGQSHGRHSRRRIFVRLGPCSTTDFWNHPNLRLRSFRVCLERCRAERFLCASSPRSARGIEKRWNHGALRFGGPLTRWSDCASLCCSIPRRSRRRRFC